MVGSGGEEVRLERKGGDLGGPAVVLPDKMADNTVVKPEEVAGEEPQEEHICRLAKDADAGPWVAETPEAAHWEHIDG